MAQTAECLCDQVLPRLPVRQWVLSVPKRLRCFMQRDGATPNMVLRIFLRLRKACRLTAPVRPRRTRRRCTLAQSLSSSA